MQTRIWDPLVRVFHWCVVAGFAANALFTDPEHWLHHWIGYAVAGLVALRILWGFIGTPHARFADFPPSPRAALDQVAEMVSGRRIVHAGHSPLGALMIYNLLACLLGLALTGWMMWTDRFFGVDWVQQVHGALATWAEVSVCLHIAAVLFESRRLGVNLPLSMVTGYKSLPDRGAPGE